MDTKKLFFLNFNSKYLLKVTDKYLVCPEEADLPAIGVSKDSADFEPRGQVEEFKTCIWQLYSGKLDECREIPGFTWIERVDFFSQPLRPGDKLFFAEMLDGKNRIDLFTRYNGDLLVNAYSRRKLNPIVAFFRHLHTVNRHRRLVRSGCFKVGLYGQGLVHDLSKYMPSEFFVGVKYYQGMRSPNVAERNTIGYSTAWLHHKGRNKHHQEYWTDYSPETGNILEFVPMPRRYLVESIMDRIAACKVYRGKNYNDSAALDYLTTRDSESHMNAENYNEMVRIFTMLSEKGEKETFRYLKHDYLK